MIRLSALLLVGLIPACEADETVARYGAGGVTWTLVELDGAPFDARVTLEFADGGPIAGQAPCNSFTTTNLVPYPWFELSPIAATKRACPDLDAETRFFTAFAAMTQSEVRPYTLFLRNDAGQEMKFTSPG
ncbi:META domain-containing protein [uncultured Tateyamaria sp.]|uniref:META domain-containing protein n=1 Tax=uncultured Tateyamaria sp. TaxID=455651 RepID=UPI00260233DB|nr:META domain-containing protein [uncultured Tateyamaria sp.]